MAVLAGLLDVELRLLLYSVFWAWQRRMLSSTVQHIQHFPSCAESNIGPVDGGHRAIIYSRVGGVKPDIYGEGTHLRIPWLNTPVDYDVRARPRIISSLTGTKDLQMVCTPQQRKEGAGLI